MNHSEWYPVSGVQTLTEFGIEDGPNGRIARFLLADVSTSIRAEYLRRLQLTVY